ncbi:SGNH/GDSL hydrolase family protein [Spiractinospora alimapuensis]|uniref:SGNH/GDSL hydrolase family protein n=1 Tax=Spiractinospora alimapuensis TaxID=2820884 RepID=UPI001F427BCB|nr:SGNH/GDSL hydrolase family protein [Spiractinospora alimapuensis]QVQ50880.1 SGNH/GDSL hydrolase family protein [Spiractinospora alimapuensis]
MNPVLLPLAAAQGLWVRARTERLPPASGDTRGSVGPVAERSLRLGVVGESTAAGCGVATHAEGFPGRLARILAERTGGEVAWEVVGHDGATARRIRHRLLARLSDDLDVAVLLSGVNDTLGRRAPEEWATDLSAIVDDLARRARFVVVAGIPPFAAFPGVPKPLGWYLAERAAALDAESRRVCGAHPAVTWVSSVDAVPVGPEFFARDRFHPSGTGYGHWATLVADHVPSG